MPSDEPDSPAARARTPDARSRRLRIEVVDGRGRRLAAAGLARWLADTSPRSLRGHAVVALVGDRTMRRLNREYRSADYATDVLSFPAAEAPGAPPDAAGGYLGDIVIATGVAGRQAREHGHPRSTEWRVLALHGLLHLVGYDHEQDGGEMARVEARLRRRGGLPSGLLARGRRP